MADAGWETVKGSGKKSAGARGAGKNNKSKSSTDNNLMATQPKAKSAAPVKSTQPKKKDILSLFHAEDGNNGVHAEEDPDSTGPTRAGGGNKKGASGLKDAVSLKTASSRLQKDTLEKHLDKISGEYPVGGSIADKDVQKMRLGLLAEFLEKHYSQFVIPEKSFSLVSRFSEQRMQLPLIHCSKPVNNVLVGFLDRLDFEELCSFYVFAVKKLIEIHSGAKKSNELGIGLQLVVQVIVRKDPEVVGASLKRILGLFPKYYVKPNVALPLFWCLGQCMDVSQSMALSVWFTAMLPCFAEGDASQQVLSYCLGFVEALDVTEICEDPYIRSYSESGAMKGKRHVITSADYELLLRVSFLDSSELCKNVALAGMRERMQNDVCLRLETLAAKSRVPQRRADVSELSKKDQKDFFLMLLKYCAAKELRLQGHVMAVICALLIKFPKTYFPIWKDIYSSKIILETNYIVAYILKNWNELSPYLPKGEVESATKFFKAKNAAIQDSESLSKKQENVLAQNSSRCDEIMKRVPDLKAQPLGGQASCCFGSCSFAKWAVVLVILACVIFYPQCGASSCSSAPCTWYHPCVLGENGHLYSILRSGQAVGTAAKEQFPIISEKLNVIEESYRKHVEPHSSKIIAGGSAALNKLLVENNAEQHLNKASEHLQRAFNIVKEHFFTLLNQMEAAGQKHLGVSLQEHADPALKELRAMKALLTEKTITLHAEMYSQGDRLYTQQVEKRLPAPVRSFVDRVMQAHANIYKRTSYHRDTPIMRSLAEIERQVILGDHIKNQIHINLEDYIENYDPNGPYYEEPALQVLMKPFHPTDDLDRYEIITLKRDTFGQPLRRDILHRVVTWQRAGWRAGTANTKTKGEVSGTGKKPFPQKGRGAARHGSLRNPQFVGGGRAHGPKPRDWSYSLPKKVRRLGIKVALSAKYAQGDLHIVDDVDMDSHKTRDMKEILTRHGWIDRETLLIGRDDMSENVRLSSYNITNLITLPVSGLNVYNILHCRNLVISSQVLSDIYMRVEGRNSQHFYNYEEMVLGKDPFENIYLGGELMTFEDGPEMEYATIEEEGIPTDTKTPPTSSGV
eukprot:Nk52_evm9s2340 gene=Nk52_evmTU9s2340